MRTTPTLVPDPVSLYHTELDKRQRNPRGYHALIAEATTEMQAPALTQQESRDRFKARFQIGRPSRLNEPGFKDKFLALWEQPGTRQDIGDTLGISLQQVMSYARILRLPDRRSMRAELIQKAGKRKCRSGKHVIPADQKRCPICYREISARWREQDRASRASA